MATPFTLNTQHLGDNHSQGIVAANIVVAILATVAVTLRFLARASTKGKYGADDYLIILALVNPLILRTARKERRAETLSSPSAGL